MTELNERTDTTTSPNVREEPRRALPPTGNGVSRQRGALVGAVVRSQEAVVLAVLIALLVGFAIAKPSNFATSGNLENLARDAAVLLVLSIGITYVTIMGMFDLSIGSVLVFSEVVAVKAMGGLGTDNAGTALLGAAVAVVAGTVWGLLNGALVARLRLSPFIVTLATFGAALGAAELVAKGNDLTAVPSTLSTFIGIDTFAGVPSLVAIAIIIAVIGGVQLAKSQFGQLTYAIGSNPEAARRVGIRVTRHIVAVYAVVGALAGAAGFLDAARFGTTSMGGHSNDALAAITAVALGGASLYGGRGTMLGTVIGVSIPAVLQNGLVILGTQSHWYQIIVAAALIASIYLDRRRRESERR
ncbi:ABC transporter permease [Candidatus Protofrankia californiensis]|uniref:ABC transporter permease n=1 Tax=Candidatus Protofrankia californiensis TaxID=1839754 RepID=UPI001041679E|nr:ABC transporter permease [Candidatus Protofrankia californiensis]